MGMRPRPKVPKPPEEWQGTKDNANVSAGRTENFYKAAKALGDYLESLNLPVEANNRMCELMMENILMAEGDAFSLGLKVGRDMARSAFKENRYFVTPEDARLALRLHGAL